MKIKFLLIVAVSFLFSKGLFAQDYSKLESIELNDKTDFAKNENLILECSNYLLNDPIEALEKDENHLKAIQFIMRWMEGTPDFMFNLDESIAEAAESNESLFGIYMACMSKFVIENKDKSKDQSEIKYNSFITFIKYCADSTKNVKQTRAIKELIKARDENRLFEYLKIESTQQRV